VKPQAALRIAVKVTPRAARDEVVGWQGESLKVKLGAVPERGRANIALTELLARELGITRRCVRVVMGHTARNKIIELSGVTRSDLERSWPRVEQG
jgi:uncharacterized protein